MSQYRRSVFIINRKFQFRFALYVCSWLLALSFVYPLIVYTLFDFFVRYASKDPSAPSVQMLFDTRQQVMWLLASLQITFLLVTFLISIFISHRIAGPLFKLSKFFEQAKTGNLKDELFFREKDHFQELASNFNEMTRGIRAREQTAVSEIQKAVANATPETRAAVEKALASFTTVK